MSESSPEKQRISAPPTEAEGKIIEERGGKISTRQSIEIREWNAPWPPPEDFNKYQESIQDRIMTVIEKESETRRGLSKETVMAEIKYNHRGQYSTFFTVIFALIVGAILVLNGHPYGLIALVGIIPTLGALLEKLRGLFHSKKDGES